VYYELENFYQNHRRYIKSKDPKQLAGLERTMDELMGTCSPVVVNADLNPGTTFLNGKLANTNSTANNTASPCGLMAKSVFTDTYTIYDPDGVNITIDDSSIAWKSDIKKYKNGQTGDYTSY
jgi:hypothetical protein